MLTAVLAVAAFVAGLTGSWSPCGFSMVSTLGEHARGRTATAVACAAFVPGALLGGVLTFGALAALGALLGGGDAALVAAAVVAGAAALAEAAGVRIAPQIRRQVPEHWRRTWPLPLAAAGYGVLLGLGFTTFVLTFAVPALAGVALAVGDVGTGVLLGLAFGAGRAVPVVVLAPLAGRPFGLRATELMADRPAILRGFRAADALALGAVVLALGAETAAAQTKAFVRLAADPSVAGGELAWTVPGGGGAVLRGPASQAAFPADDVAIGGALVATLGGGVVRVADRATGAERGAYEAAGADAVAVGDRHVVLRRVTTAGEQLEAVRLADGVRSLVAAVERPGQLGRPSLDGDRLVFHLAGRSRSRIEERDLATGARLTLRTDRRRLLTDASVSGERLLWVETTPYRQSLVLGTRLGPERLELLRIAPAIDADKGYATSFGLHRPDIPRPTRPAKEGPPGTTTTLGTTALAGDAAYVTRLRERAGARRSDLLRIALPARRRR